MIVVWRALAHMLARWFWLQNLVIGSAMKRPYSHLPGYMDRWWLLPGAAADSKESRYRPPWWLRRFPISIRLHHIKRPDGDRNLHDHPCDFRSIVLAGYYVETRENACWRTNHWRYAGETYFSKAEQYHSIIKFDLSCNLRSLCLLLTGGGYSCWRYECWYWILALRYSVRYLSAISISASCASYIFRSPVCKWSRILWSSVICRHKHSDVCRTHRADSSKF